MGGMWGSVYPLLGIDGLCWCCEAHLPSHVLSGDSSGGGLASGLGRFSVSDVDSVWWMSAL